MTSGYLYAIAAAITWGIVYTFDQRILKDMSPFPLLFLSSAITVIILLPIMFYDKGAFTSLAALTPRLWVYNIISLILAALANYFIFSSIKLIGAPTASIFEIAYPFFVVLFSFIAFQAVPNIFFFLGGFLIFGGATIIMLFAH